MKSKSFHHGNLREELITTATQMLNEKGMEGLSLRGVAQALNVSSAAPFRHFKNKDELMKALALEAGDKLSKIYEVAKLSKQSDEKRLGQACMAYLDCAEKTPHLFKLMFMESSSFLNFYIDPATEYYGYRLFEDLVSALISGDEDLKRTREVTVSCWALLHGFATLHMAACLETVDYKKEQAVAAVIALAKSSGALPQQ